MIGISRMLQQCNWPAQVAFAQSNCWLDVTAVVVEEVAVVKVEQRLKSQPACQATLVQSATPALNTCGCLGDS